MEWTVMELTPEELLDAALGFIAMNPPQDIAHKGEIDFVHEVAYEAQLAKLQELM